MDAKFVTNAGEAVPVEHVMETAVFVEGRLTADLASWALNGR